MAACSSDNNHIQDRTDEFVEGEESDILSDDESGQSSVEGRKQEDGDVQAFGSYPDGSTPQLSGVRLKLTVDASKEAVIAMYDNTAADAFLERLPLTELSFFDLSGVEKPIERLEEPLSLGEEEPGYDPVAGEMVIYRPWGNFTIFYGDFGHSDELVPLGIVESGLEVIAGQTEDFTGMLELLETDS